MKKVHNRARIHGSLILMGLTIIGNIGVIIHAKRAAEKGQSLQKMNEDFHRDYELKHK